MTVQKETIKKKPGRPKGSPGGPGRPKGVPNKLTADVKAAILEAFRKAGGADYLAGIAVLDPKAFCSLLGKVVPSEIKADVNNTGSVTYEVVTGVPRAPNG